MKGIRISEYEKRGFEGSDADLETSLFEYGLIWKQYKRAVKKYPCVKGECFFVAYVGPIDGKEGRWTTGWIDPNRIPIEEEFDWVDWDSFLSCNDQTMEEFKSMDFGMQVFLLTNYYGADNTIGSTGWWET